MPYCQHCGNEVDQVPGAEGAHEAVSAEVEIEKIRAEKEIAIARIQARQEKDWNETSIERAEIEAGAEVAAAEATAEIIGEVIAAESESGDDTETEAEPIIVTAEPDNDGEDMAPPLADSPITPKGKPGWSFA